jgi:alkaline phosphatase D
LSGGALLRHFQERKIANPSCSRATSTATWANELVADFDQLDSRSVAVEFVGTSITSKGDGTEKKSEAEVLRAENPFVKFFNDERGYVRCEVTPRMWRTDFRTVPFVSRRNAPLNTRASFVVEAGRPALSRV